MSGPIEVGEPHDVIDPLIWRLKDGFEKALALVEDGRIVLGNQEKPTFGYIRLGGTSAIDVAVIPSLDPLREDIWKLWRYEYIEPIFDAMEGPFNLFHLTNRGQLYVDKYSLPAVN